MVGFTTVRGNPNKIGFNLIYINLKYIYTQGYKTGVQLSSVSGEKDWFWSLVIFLETN